MFWLVMEKKKNVSKSDIFEKNKIGYESLGKYCFQKGVTIKPDGSYKFANCIHGWNPIKIEGHEEYNI